MNYATDQQQPPQAAPGSPASWTLVRNDLDARRRRQEAPTPVIDAAYQEAFERDQFGRAKYGVPLRPNNGRDSLDDAYQEAMDLAVYLRNAAEEAGPAGNDLRLPQLYNDSVVLMLRLRGLIFERDGR
jgi:hypothetical protein